MKNLLQKRGLRITAIIAAVVLTVAILINYVIMPLYVYAPEVEVPDVLGLTPDAAYTALDEAGLEPFIGDTSYNSKYESGKIIFQKPFATAVVKKGRKIMLVINGTEKLVDVPDIRSLSVDEARVLLAEKGLRLGSRGEVNSTIPTGKIVSQYPFAGNKVKRDSPITVKVSIGEEEGSIELPSLYGKSVTEARKILDNLKLRVGRISTRPNDELLPNTILDQYPAPGTKMKEDEKVDLFVVEASNGNEGE